MTDTIVEPATITVIVAGARVPRATFSRVLNSDELPVVYTTITGQATSFDFRESDVEPDRTLVRVTGLVEWSTRENLIGYTDWREGAH